VDPLPFVRPDTRATGLYGAPAGARKHKKVLLPGQGRWANYAVDGDMLTGAGPYTAKVELVAGMIPINLLNVIQIVGFDYGMSAKQIGDAIVEGHQVLWTEQHVFNVN